MGRRSRIARTYRRDQHPQRLVRRHVAGCGPAEPGFLAIDGNRFRTRLDIPYKCIVKGDASYADIAAASVLAKTHRDEYMERLAEAYPMYGWARNMGYPTREHRLAIREYGLTPHHRLTFNHEIDQLEIPFDQSR